MSFNTRFFSLLLANSRRSKSKSMPLISKRRDSATIIVASGSISTCSFTISLIATLKSVMSACLRFCCNSLYIASIASFCSFISGVISSRSRYFQSFNSVEANVQYDFLISAVSHIALAAFFSNDSFSKLSALIRSLSSKSCSFRKAVAAAIVSITCLMSSLLSMVGSLPSAPPSGFAV